MCIVPNCKQHLQPGFPTFMSHITEVFFSTIWKTQFILITVNTYSPLKMATQACLFHSIYIYIIYICRQTIHNIHTSDKYKIIQTCFMCMSILQKQYIYYRYLCHATLLTLQTRRLKSKLLPKLIENTKHSLSQLTFKTEKTECPPKRSCDLDNWSRSS